MNDSNREKISFLFPFKINEDGNRQPVLVYECNSLPDKTNINLAVYFVGLKASKIYDVQINITFNDKDILGDEFEKSKIFKVLPSDDGETLVSASFQATFKNVLMENSGIHRVSAYLYAEGFPSVPLATNRAYFDVKKIGEARHEFI
ncbi:hypothetical protein [Yersinia enterocolitica]|uniref:hypothetical protein n=1 Tax=Yersinia enterocolitica TaxID=630 RepID=UPI0033106BBC|nr:hypothetical protein [Yersinia enterocolitica]HDL7960211.1 hypothetical protein [Yersinia enterocolitica]